LDEFLGVRKPAERKNLGIMGKHLNTRSQKLRKTTLASRFFRRNTMMKNEKIPDFSGPQVLDSKIPVRRNSD